MRYEDATVAFPFELKPRVWFYRSDIFEEAGIDADEIKTTDDFIAAGRKLQEKFPGKYICNVGSSAPGYLFYMALSGNGARFTDEDGNYMISQDEGTRKVLEDYRKIVESGVSMDVSDFTTDWEAALADGSLVSSLSASWLAQDLCFQPMRQARKENGHAPSGLKSADLSEEATLADRYS